MKFSKLYSFAVLLFLLSACSPDNPTNNNTDPDNDIYLAGYRNSNNHAQAIYWKNGIPTELNAVEGSLAESIFVNGSDVYIVGDNNQHNDAILWKNNNIISIPNTTRYTEFKSVFVSGNDVYITGDDSRYQPKYWKNGAITYLLPAAGSANCIYVTPAGDVYVSGLSIRNLKNVATYWKNSVPILLTDSVNSNDASANAIFVDGNDVYVAGVEDNGINYVGKYWKNGQVFTLTDGTNNTRITSIKFANGNVYVGGGETVGASGVNYIAKYWKNGLPVILGNANSGNTSQVLSMFIEGENVYACGYDGQNAVYWKNGVETIVGPGVARSIYVVKK